MIVDSKASYEWLKGYKAALNGYAHMTKFQMLKSDIYRQFKYIEKLIEHYEADIIKKHEDETP